MIITVKVRKDLSPNTFMWRDNQTYAPSLTLYGYDFKSPEDAFEDAKRVIQKHWASPDDLLFVLDKGEEWQ